MEKQFHVPASVLALLVLAISLAACGGKQSSPSNGGTNETPVKAQPVESSQDAPGLTRLLTKSFDGRHVVAFTDGKQNIGCKPIAADAALTAPVLFSTPHVINEVFSLEGGGETGGPHDVHYKCGLVFNPHVIEIVMEPRGQSESIHVKVENGAFLLVTGKEVDIKRIAAIDKDGKVLAERSYP